MKHVLTVLVKNLNSNVARMVPEKLMKKDLTVHVVKPTHVARTDQEDLQRDVVVKKTHMDVAKI